MIRNILSVFVLALTATSASAIAAEPGRCLRWVDIKDLTRLNAYEAVATTNSQTSFVIKFTASCDFQQFTDHYVVVEPEQRLACVTPLDTFHVHNSGACLIEKISQVPAKPAP